MSCAGETIAARSIRPNSFGRPLPRAGGSQKEPLLFRLVSGNDSANNIFLESGCSFISKCSLRRESREGWLQEAKARCLDITHPREGKDIYVGSTWHDISYVGSDGEKHPFTVRTVYEITERSIDSTSFQQT